MLLADSELAKEERVRFLSGCERAGERAHGVLLSRASTSLELERSISLPSGNEADKVKMKPKPTPARQWYVRVSLRASAAEVWRLCLSHAEARTELFISDYDFLSGTDSIALELITHDPLNGPFCFSLS